MPSRATLPAVPVGVATGTAGVTVAVTGVEAVTGQARGVGQVAGPAVRITLRLINGSGAALALGVVTVDLRDGAGASAPQLSGPDADPFSGTVAAGGQATAAYVFELAEDDRAGLSLLVAASPATPVVLVSGVVVRARTEPGPT